MVLMRTRRRSVAVALVALLGGGAAVAQDRSFDAVTDAMLENPDPADWLNWRRTLDGWGYSPLDQINRDNVHQLQLVWSWTMDPGLSQATPIVHDGVMYVPNPLNVVQALDAVTGDLIWEYHKEFELSPDDSFRSRTRSIAIYDDKIYLNTSDAHIVALDARSGEVVWDHTVADNSLGYRYTSGPIIVKGKVVAGMTGCERYKNGTCFISAHDPQTGAEVWRTSTIAQPGDPGGDTWGDLPPTFRAGGDAWISRQLRPRNQPHVLVDVAGQTVGAVVTRHRRRRALHEQRACTRPGDRPARMVLPVRAGRDARSGRSVRERAHRSQRAPIAVQDGQARHLVGARSRDRSVCGGPRPRLSDARRRRPGNREDDLQTGHDSETGGRAGVLPGP